MHQQDTCYQQKNESIQTTCNIVMCAHQTPKNRATAATAEVTFCAASKSKKRSGSQTRNLNLLLRSCAAKTTKMMPERPGDGPNHEEF